MDPRHVPVATRTVSPQEAPSNPAVTPQLIPQPIVPEPTVTSGVTQPQQ
jgi:hypothetical protein